MAAEGSKWFTAGHIRLLEAIAGSAAVALEHARCAWLEGESRRFKESQRLPRDAGQQVREPMAAFQTLLGLGASEPSTNPRHITGYEARRTSRSYTPKADRNLWCLAETTV